MTDEKLHLTDHWPVAPGHELSQVDWDAIKAAADEWAGRSDDGQWSPQIPTYVDIAYPGAGGRKDSGTATKQLWVIHTAECPLRTGYARSLSLWGADSTVQASWHRMSDPGTVARFVPPGRAAWHATIANRISVGYEQAGYAAFPRETWLNAEGIASIDRLAQALVDDGIPAAAVRVLTDDEVRAALNGDTSISGLCAHAQIQPRDRTDPGAGYPWDVLLDRIRAHHPNLEGDDMEPVDVWNGVKWGGESAGDRLGKAAAAYDKAVAVEKKVDALTSKLDALAKAPAVGGSINVDAVAQAVADVLVKRMQS